MHLLGKPIRPISVILQKSSYNILEDKIFNVSRCQIAGLLLKSQKDPSIPKPAAFDYSSKKFNAFDSLFDSVLKRFDENSKVITVEGPLASDKTRVCKAIADAFDLVYLPPPTIDSHYMTEDGDDMMEVNDKLPYICQKFTRHDFLQNPTEFRRTRFQFLQYGEKIMQHCNAMNHILNTGQGIVLERSIFYERGLIEVFMKHGFLPSTFQRHLLRNHACLIGNKYMKFPHCVVYLDQSVDKTMERIKARDLPEERNSPVCTREVQESIEAKYKQYLQKFQKDMVILNYPWNEDCDRSTDIIIEDLSMVNLDVYHWEDRTCKNWRDGFGSSEFNWNWDRSIFINDMDNIKRSVFANSTSCFEAFVTLENSTQRDEIVQKHFGRANAKEFDYLVVQWTNLKKLIFQFMK